MAVVKSKALNTLQGERRRAVRRELCLEAEAVFSADRKAPVIIHELSQTGFLMEAAEQNTIGDRVYLQMADLAAAAARVIWSCGTHYGCEFQRPLSNAAVSTALLKARPAAIGETRPRGIRLSDTQFDNETSSQSAAPPRLQLMIATSVLLWALVAALVVIGR